MDLNDPKPNLLIGCSSGEPLDQERRQVPNVVIPKRSNGLRLVAGGVFRDPSAILDDHAAKDPSHRVWR
jgi:hypothetical protein